MSLEIARKVTELESRLRKIEARAYPLTLGDLIGSYLALPELRAFWPFSSSAENGDLADLSGQTRTMSNNGSAVRATINGFVAYGEFDGADDYYNRADEAGLDITEDLTVGCWVWLDDTSVVDFIIAKGDNSTAAGSSFALYSLNGVLQWDVFDGATPYQLGGEALEQGAWQFVVGRFNPSTELASFINISKTTDATAPATINNVATGLHLGANAGTDLLTGRMSMAFVCASALEDEVIESLFLMGKVFFGL